MDICLRLVGEKVFDIIAPNIVNKISNSMKTKKILNDLKNEIDTVTLNYRDTDIALLSSDFDNFQSNYFNVEKIFTEKLCYQTPLIKNRDDYINKLIGERYHVADRNTIMSYFKKLFVILDGAVDKIIENNPTELKALMVRLRDDIQSHSDKNNEKLLIKLDEMTKALENPKLSLVDEQRNKEETNLSYLHITKSFISNIKSSNRCKKDIDNSIREFYTVTDNIMLLFRIICNKSDVPNEIALSALRNTIESNSTVFLSGNGGIGKTTLMVRLAVEYALTGNNVFLFSLKQVIKNLNSNDLESQIKKILNYTNDTVSEQSIIFIDNPYENLNLLQEFQNLQLKYNYKIVIAERSNRLEDALVRNSEFDFEHWNETAYFICLTLSETENPFRWINQSNINNLVIEKSWREDVLNSSIKYLEENYNISLDILNSQLKKVIEKSSMSIVESLYCLFSYYNKEIAVVNSKFHRKHKKIPFDWVEFGTILRKYEELKNLDSEAIERYYSYIAALYLFKVPMTVETLSSLIGISRFSQFLPFIEEQFNNGLNEPLFYSNGSLYLKHDMMAELYFKYSSKITADSKLKTLLTHMDSKTFILLEKKLLSKKNINSSGIQLFDIVPTDYIDIIKKDDRLTSILIKEERLYSLHMAEVWSFMNTKQINKGLSLLRKLIDENKNNQKLITEYILLCDEYKKKDELKNAFDKYDIEEITVPSVLTKYGLFMKKINPNKAEKLFLKSYNLKPDYINNLKEIADLYSQKNLFQKVKSLFDKAIEDTDNINIKFQIYILYGDFCSNSNRFDEAEQLYSLAIDIHFSYNLLIKWAEATRKNGKILNMEILYENHFSKIEITTNSLIQLGHLHYYNDEFDTCLSYFMQALEHDKSDRGNCYALNSIIVFYKINREFKMLKTFLLKAYDKYSNNIELLSRLGSLHRNDYFFYLRNIKNYTKATEEFKQSKFFYEKALSLNEKNIHILLNLGKLYKINKTNRAHKKELANIYKNISELTPNNSTTLKYVSKLYKELGFISEAIFIYSKIVDLLPQNATVLIEQSKLYIENKEYENAMRNYEKILEHDSLNAYVYSLIGNLYFYYFRNESKAGENHEKALKLQPDNSRILYNAGVYYFKIEDYERAVILLKESLEINFYNKTATILSEIYLKSNSCLCYVESLLHKANELYPNDVYILDCLREVSKRKDESELELKYENDIKKLKPKYKFRNYNPCMPI